tara:strand:- start:6792 stop:8441 length:1650 start_codon:yes stop_codon:yes gene_type:complete
MSNFFFNFFLYFTKSKLKKKFIKHNLKIFKSQKKKIEEEILIEFNGWQICQIINSYILNSLLSVKNYRVRSYPAYISNNYSVNLYTKVKFLISNFFPTNNFLVYKSFGVNSFFFPHLSIFEKVTIKKIFQKEISKIKNKKDLVEYKYKNIWIGDLIYDSYLKNYSLPTIDITACKFRNFFHESLKTFIFWEKYLKTRKVKKIIISHGVYLPAVLMRIAVSKNIPVYSGNILSLYNFQKNLINPWCEFKSHRKLFNKLSSHEKFIAKKEAKRRIELRFKGIKRVDMRYSKKSSFLNKKLKSKIKKDSKIKILIASHCFLDSPHVYGVNLFNDFLEWLEFLYKISKKTNYSWYIKTHPDYKPQTKHILNEFLREKKEFKLLPPNYSHHQIISEKINFALTTYGTIGWEYAALGIPVINASTNNPHIGYNFNINPKNIEEYEKKLMNLKELKHKIKLDEVYEYYFMMFLFHDVDWLVNDYKKLEQIFGKYENSFSDSIFEKWLNIWTEEKHKRALYNVNNFLKSNKYKILPSDCKRSIKDLIAARSIFQPKT